MKKYEICIEGTFTKEFYINAESEDEARLAAEKDFNLLIGLDKEDYVVDSVTTSLAEGM